MSPNLLTHSDRKDIIQEMFCRTTPPNKKTKSMISVLARQKLRSIFRGIMASSHKSTSMNDAKSNRRVSLRDRQSSSKISSKTIK